MSQLVIATNPRARRWIAALAAAAAIAVGGTPWGLGSTAIAAPDVQTFEFTGATQTFNVPEGVCSLTIDAYGGQGGRGANPDGPRVDGGRGGHATATITVAPAEVLEVYVGGGATGRAGGWNGGGAGGDGDEEDGGGGGGASDVRREPYGLDDRLVVAGGGGGSGADPDSGGLFSAGGAGGGANGGAGVQSDSGPPTPAGLGGTQTAGGAAPTSFDPNAQHGTFGQGGKGGEGRSDDDAGGGGGGGWYGGGGGAGEDDDVESDGGGGGGGGSGFGPGGTTFESGVRSGDGLVAISYETGSCDLDFDWTAQDGFGADELAPSGLVDSYAPDGPLVVDKAFPIDFETSDVDSCDASETLVWLIDGAEATEPQAEFGPCTMTYEFAEEKVYEVTLQVRDEVDEVLQSHTEEVLVQDWLIVSIGDSVASGEGNPDRTSFGLTPETWQDQQCHRTALAGPAQAAMLIEQADPKTSVTFIHLACSGATIDEGLIGRYRGIEPGQWLPPQLNDLVTHAGDREIDAITVSIGANDVHFSKVVEKCVIQPLCHTDTPGSAARFFGEKVATLPGRYAALQAGFVDRNLDTSRVFITQYFDPTRTDLGTVCPSGTILGDAPVVGPGSLQISEAEGDWASNGMLVRLDQEVRAAAAAHQWHFVGGIREPYFTHGYCAVGSWIVRITESFAYQGDKNGALHPNAPGHAFYGLRIASDLTLHLYEGGDLSKPRHPAP